MKLWETILIDTPVLAPPRIWVTYFAEFQIIKTSWKGAFIQKLIHLLNLQPYEVKFIFKNETMRNPSDWLPGAWTTGESTLKDYF